MALLYQLRRLKKENNHLDVLARLAWDLRFRTQEDRKEFDSIMEKSFETKLEHNPGLRSKEMYPHAQGTIPFTIRECQIMEERGINGKQYRQNAFPAPEISVEEMKKILNTPK